MKTKLLILATFILIFGSCKNKQEQAASVETATYDETWESLATNNKEPEWFKDAKFGIYFHWGVYSVPAFNNEWYPRWMYYPNRGDIWGGGVYEHHKNTYGSDFDYHDFIPMFKAEHFDAKEWAALFKKTGAKFAGPVAQHHDGFAMWGSKVNPWNANVMGPEKDILGDLFKELKTLDLKTIATFHHAKLGQRYANDSTNWIGKGLKVSPNSHFPYHPDLVTSTTDPKLRLLYGNLEEEEFNSYWLDQVKEVVDSYAPDIIWFDSWLDQIPENYRQKMVAHHFNSGTKNKQEPIVAYKQKDLPTNVGVLDIEQGGKTEISEDYWLTDITLSNRSWSYIKGQTYKAPDLVIRNMIDVWSKKGIVLLNISPRADGIINDEQREVLAAIGVWIDKHKEAVYGTRTHTVYGYGVAAFEKGHFGGQSATIKYSNLDYRFTTSKDKKTLYIYALGLPEANTKLPIKHVGDIGHSQSVKKVSVVGSGTELEWAVNTDQLVIQTPEAAAMDNIATVFKVEFE
ncbi:alpha-L-fucosidase [Tamlana sp. 2201CG12-4]|uniref:alpha-L-fucosidase n=1 Tax=Tamlana sp. 2201CG12-4 TaxID=3112582 RepID=UPI002DBA3FB1|nr:alpha-L-fucosidase [Tamlana sp. 2201CG12-4]MEC3905746.1 alpha-L-fucosidase [Tamlana sp. 2201CG12-4]